MAVLFESGFIPRTPLNHARIGYEQLITEVSATGSATGFPPEAALIETTHERWRPAELGDSLTLTLDQPALLEYIGIGAHTLRDALIEIEVDGTYVPLVTFPLDGPSLSSDFAAQEYMIYSEYPDAEAVMILLTGDKLVSAIRITPEDADATVGYVSAGRVLEMLRPFYGGHAPAMLNETVDRLPTESESGQWLGMSVIRQGRATRMDWENLPAPWYRREVQPFVEHAKSGTFFIAWNALRFPGDCLYAHLESDPAPSNQGVRDLMSVSFDVRAYHTGQPPAVASDMMRSVTYNQMWDLADRPSPKWVFGPDGLLVEVLPGEPAYQYDPVTGEPLGLLIEWQRTNLLLWSEDLSNPKWAKGNVSVSGGFSAPDGAATAFKVSASTLGELNTILNLVGTNVTGSVSIYLKGEESASSIVLIAIDNSAPIVRVDLNAGIMTNISPGTNAELSALKNGWFRLELTPPTTIDRITVYAGRFGALETPQEFYMWGAQVEAGSFPTSYIPTEGSQVTRLADSVSRTLGAEFNAAEGNFSVTATVPVGETVVQAGSFSIVSDSDTEKTYTASYTEDPSATTLDIAPSASSATIKSLTYNPRSGA